MDKQTALQTLYTATTQARLSKQEHDACLEAAQLLQKELEDKPTKKDKK